MGSAFIENKVFKQKENQIQYCLRPLLTLLANKIYTRNLIKRYIIKGIIKLLPLRLVKMEKEKSIQQRNSSHSQRTITSSGGLKNDHVKSRGDNATKLENIR